MVKEPPVRLLESDGSAFRRTPPKRLLVHSPRPSAKLRLQRGVTQPARAMLTLTPVPPLRRHLCCPTEPRLKQLLAGALCGWLLLATSSCDTKTTGSGAPAATTGGAAATAGPSTSAPSITSSAKPASPYAGSWRGSYQAKPGSVTIPKGVRYPSWQQDDGKANVGKGNITLQVGPDGSLSGDASGALGDQKVSGRLDDEGLSAALSAAPEAGQDGLSGVLNGSLNEGEIAATMRVSNGTGELVREAQVSLTRGPKRSP